MNVVELDLSWEHAYADFLDARTDSLLYASLRYRTLLKALLGCRDEYLLAITNGRIEGVLPLMALEVDGKLVYNSLPYFGSNGGVIANTPSAALALVDAYNARITRPHVAAATVVPSPFEPTVLGFRKTHEDVRIAMCIDLQPNDAELETFVARIDSAARRNVRKAMSEGVEVRKDASQLGALRDMHCRNMDAIGARSKSDAFFDLMPQCFKAGREWDLYVATLAGRTIAALLVFYFGRTVEYFTPAVEEEYRNMQALPLIIAHAVGYAARRGMTRWNWGATAEGQTGVYRFKKKWASRESRYTYATFVQDMSLLTKSPTALLKKYGHFYVVPFSVLTPHSQPPASMARGESEAAA
jgi:hypothetical protein